MEGTPHYAQYVRILKEELLPALGCTEPIAIAYAAAKARETLGRLPERCQIEVSGNIIKNVKSVSVPHTGGLKGIAASVAAGVTVGDGNASLEVLSRVDPAQVPSIAAYMESHVIRVLPADTDLNFYIAMRVFDGVDSAEVIIENYHTNIVSIRRNDHQLFCADGKHTDECVTDRSVLNVEEIVRFADTVQLSDVSDCLQEQIRLNSAIAEEGLTGHWGAEIGRTLLGSSPDDPLIRARAYAAAGSDARMSGCGLPVIIVSGSGNQGLTCSLPVIVYAKELGCSEERLLRALIVSDLVTIHQKTGIGRLSAYCGAVSAGCGAGTGIAYLKHGADYRIIAHTLVNAVAILSGMVCDGAKPSCAAKIAAAVDAGILGLNIYENGHHQFIGGEGIVAKGVENTIRNVSRIAHDGMCETDKQILRIMVEEGPRSVLDS